MTTHQIAVSDFLRNNYGDYGRFVNLNRVTPGVDGLKSVQRRILFALNEEARGTLISTMNAIGKTLTYHPFGDKSCEGVINDMARVGILESQGDFGAMLMENIPAAAPRYTKVGLSKEKAAQMFNLINFVPKIEGEELIEPMYIPVPVPFALVTGSLCWGLGMLDKIPAFRYESILAAFKNDDPSLLESQYGYIMDKSKSELDKLWNEGEGRIHLSYKVSRVNKDEILISGSGELFTPSIETFKPLQLDGQIKVSDESDSSVNIRITRISGARKVDMDEVFEDAKRIAVHNRKYTIRMSLNDKARRVSMKAWIEACMALYNKAFNESKEHRIKQVEKSIEVLTILPEIGKLVIAGKSDEEIQEAVKVDLEIVKTAIKKPVSMLRRASFEAEIEKLKSELEDIKKSTIETEIDKFAEIFSNL